MVLCEMGVLILGWAVWLAILLRLVIGVPDRTQARPMRSIAGYSDLRR